MPWARPPCTWPSTISGLTTVPTSSTRHVRADLRPARSRCRPRPRTGACRAGRRSCPGRRSRRRRCVGSTPSGRSCAANVASAISWIVTAPCPGRRGPRTRRRRTPGRSAEASSRCAAITLRLLDDLVARRDHGDAADGQRARPVGVHALAARSAVSPCSTSMSSNGTPSASATIWLHAVSWPWPCGAGAGDDLDLAGGQHPDRRRAPSRPRRSASDAEHPGRGQPAHLGEGRDADAELHRVVPARAAAACSARSSS